MNHLTITMRGRITGRIFLYWLAFIGVYRAGGVIASFSPGNIHFPGFGNWISGTFAAFFVTWLFLKWEKSSFDSIGLFWEKGTLLRFFQGFLLGSSIFIVMVFVLNVCGGGQIQRTPWKWDGDILMAYLTIIPLGIMEEVAFRSYSLILLNQAFGVRVTLLITAFAFALYHVSMGWSFYIAFTGPFVWSFVFGLAALRSKGIALPSGIHISVNILQNVIGLHSNKALLWIVSFPENSQRSGWLIGLFLQIGLLAASLIAMELFIRWNKGGRKIRSASL